MTTVHVYEMIYTYMYEQSRPQNTTLFKRKEKEKAIHTHPHPHTHTHPPTHTLQKSDNLKLIHIQYRSKKVNVHAVRFALGTL